MHLHQQDIINFVVDMSHATYINSGGLRVLVSGWRTSRQQGGDLLLCGLNDHLQAVIQMIGFHKLIQIFPDCAEAQAWVFK